MAIFIGMFLILLMFILMFDLLYYPKVITGTNIVTSNYSGICIKDLVIQEVYEDRIYCSRGYCIYVSEDNGKLFRKKLKVKIPFNSFRHLGNSKILRTVFDYYEFLEMKILKSGTILILADFKIYRICNKEKKLKKVKNMNVFDKKEVRRVMSFGITEDNNGNVYYGEYTRNSLKDSVSVYRSSDDGQTWEVYYSFDKGSIRHIHSVQYDKFSGKVWATTGDSDNECMIGFFDKNDKFHILFKGSQKYRCVSLLFTEEYIYWAMDDRSSQNYIYCYERKSDNIYEVCSIDGPAYYSQILTDGSLIFETAVEGGRGEWDDKVSIWLKTINSNEFDRALTFKKNFKSKKRANIRFPKGNKLENITFTVMNTIEHRNDTIILNRYKY